eukprot:1429580-Pyramimonas_sp.AAC.1
MSLPWLDRMIGPPVQPPSHAQVRAELAEAIRVAGVGEGVASQANLDRDYQLRANAAESGLCNRTGAV